MTVITMPHTAVPQSQRLDELKQTLANEDYAGFRAEIQQAIDNLRRKADG
jgi:hypothetical protein